MRKYFDFVEGTDGRAVRGASVRVTTYPADVLATLYADSGAVTPLANPLTTDGAGYYEFYIADGHYTIRVDGAGLAEQVIQDVVIYDPTNVLSGLEGAAASAAAAASSAGAASTSATLAQASATAATTSATDANTAKTAAQTAQAAAEAADNIFTTTTLGLAGTVNGKYFGVKQVNGDAANIYLNNAGTAVKQTGTLPVGTGLTIVQAVQLGSASSIVGSLPITPIIDINTAAMYDLNGRCVPGAGVSSSTVNRNMVAECSGRIIGANRSGVTETEYYANGPQAKLTAKRLQFNDSSTYDVTPGGVILPAGPYTVKFQAKATGGSNQSFNYGVAAGGGGSMTAGSALAAGWTQFSFTVTPNGTSDTPRVSLTNTSGAPIDILIDEVQWYLSEETIPAFSTELNNQANLKPELAYQGSLTRDGNALDVRTNTINGFVPFSTFPLKKTFDPTLGVTLMVMAKATDAAIIASKMLSFDGSESTLGVGTQQGKAYAAPVLPRGSTNPAHYIAGQGWHVWTLRVKNGEQAFWIDKIKHTIGTTATPTIPTKSGLLVGGDEATGSSLQFKGEYSQIFAWDRWLTDAQVAQAYNVLVARHQIAGLIAPDTDTVVFMEGDSIFENTSTAPNGPNWAGQHAQTNPSGLIYMNNAVSGSNLTHLTTRLTSTDLTGRIAVAVANGYKVIVVVLIGANGIPTIADLETYWQALKTAGAKVVACTVLPREDAGDGGTAFNAARATLNTQIRASTVPNAVADLAADASIGVNGAPTAGTYYQADKTHLNAAGHAIAQTIIVPKVNTLR
jgi:hypothetical protein